MSSTIDSSRSPQLALVPTRFKCTRCGNCCRGPGHARLFPNDLARLAQHFSVALDDFVRARCVLLVETHRFPDDVLTFSTLGLQRDDDACVFLTASGCSVHAAKPLVCSLAPFSRTHWFHSDSRQRFLQLSKGFGHGPLWSEEDLAKSMRRETEQWDRYLGLLRSNPTLSWWTLYGLQAQPNLITVEWTAKYDRPWSEVSASAT